MLCDICVVMGIIVAVIGIFICFSSMINNYSYDTIKGIQIILIGLSLIAVFSLIIKSSASEVRTFNLKETNGSYCSYTIKNDKGYIEITYLNDEDGADITRKFAAEDVEIESCEADELPSITICYLENKWLNPKYGYFTSQSSLYKNEIAITIKLPDKEETDRSEAAAGRTLNKRY